MKKLLVLLILAVPSMVDVAFANNGKQSVYIDMAVPIHSGYGIYELDPTTGEILHYFDPSGATFNVGNIWIEEHEMYSVRGSENAIYVTDLINRESTLLSSHEIINVPSDVIIAKNGDLLIVNDYGREILKFDAASGEYKGVFSDPPRGVIELHHGPDGDLYALSGPASSEETSVQVLDPDTGALQRTFAAPYSFTMGFAANGYLLTASRDEVGSDLFSYDAATGIQQMVYDEPFDLPTSISVGPDGMIWISDSHDNLVYLLDPASYLQVDTFDADSVGGSSQFHYDLAFGSSSGVATPTPGADCLCEVQNINPNQVVLQNVGTGGKGANSTRKMVMTFHAVDAPGATCDPGEFSAPAPVNLKMEDDRGNILIDSAKTVVCGHGMTTNVKRNVFFQGPLNCENGALPPPKPGFSLGTITSTGSAPGTADYVESTKIKCFE
jgi:hypothetical protein